MARTLLVTNITRDQKEYIATALYEDGSLIEAFCEEQKKQSLLGNIYVGRVKDVVKNLNAAFIEIAPGLACYYSLEDFEHPVFVKKIKSPQLVQGDELLVQVVKESIKTKPPRVSTNLSISGKYLVLTTGNRRLGISKKLACGERERLKALLEQVMGEDEPFGLVARTNCGAAKETAILEEFSSLRDQILKIIQKAPYRTCFSCVWEKKPEYLNYLQNVYTEGLEQITTDDEELFTRMKEFLEKEQPLDLKLLKLYEDPLLSLSKLYGLESALESALKERVWLKSGAYLIIQPTEALTVVDVNTGKSMAKQGVQEHYLKVNLEAARETARQLRLRNLSGIILIDFIDMKSQEDKAHLMEELKRFTQKDPVPVQVVDMTKLNLVELTRKKVRKSLREQLSGA